MCPDYSVLLSQQSSEGKTVMDLALAIGESRMDFTRLIIVELMLRRLWEIYAIPQKAQLRDIWLFYVRCAGVTLHWMWSWMYHHRGAMHCDSNEVWDDIIGSGTEPFSAIYRARHSRGWTGPVHAASS